MNPNSTTEKTIDIKRVIISGGGTGGHIFPAISIANALRRRFPTADILFVGADNRMEMERVPAAGYPIEGLEICGFDRKNIFRNISVLIKLRKAMARAKSIIKNFNPQIVIGVGGFASGPTLKAAQKLGIPTLIQEQNSYAGVTNKLLAKKAKRICVAYEGMNRFFPAENIVMTGNPVRKNLLDSTLTARQAKIKLGFNPDRPLVLIVGGSLGARTINESVATSLDLLTTNGTQILWQTGKNYANDEALKASEGKPGIIATPFIFNMDVAYAAADLVVSRSGAGSISELQLLGKASILVPSPNVAEDHQRKNALALVCNHAAIMVEDHECKARLAQEVNRLIAEPLERQKLSQNIIKMAIHNSDEKIVDELISIVNATSIH